MWFVPSVSIRLDDLGRRDVPRERGHSKQINRKCPPPSLCVWCVTVPRLLALGLTFSSPPWQPQTLPFKTIQHNITKQDCQPTPDNCIVVMVMGQLKVSVSFLLCLVFKVCHTKDFKTFYTLPSSPCSYIVENDFSQWVGLCAFSSFCDISSDFANLKGPCWSGY